MNQRGGWYLELEEVWMQKERKALAGAYRVSYFLIIMAKKEIKIENKEKY